MLTGNMKPGFVCDIKECNGLSLEDSSLFFLDMSTLLKLYLGRERYNNIVREWIEEEGVYLYLDCARIYIEPTLFFGYYCVSIQHKILTQYGIEWCNLIQEGEYINRFVKENHPLYKTYYKIWKEQLHVWFLI